jgi:hypothetical protein
MPDALLATVSFNRAYGATTEWVHDDHTLSQRALVRQSNRPSQNPLKKHNGDIVVSFQVKDADGEVIPEPFVLTVSASVPYRMAAEDASYLTAITVLKNIVQSDEFKAEFLERLVNLWEAS